MSSEINADKEQPLEIWKPVVGFEGRYEVSNLGNIRSLNYHRKKGLTKILSQFPDKGGYMRVRFCEHGRMFTAKVHRVVAESFLPNPEGKREVNHIDGNTKNNALSNLEWVTPSENMRHAYQRGAVKLPRVFPVEQIDLAGNVVREWSSARQAGLELGFDPSVITKCCKGKLNKTHGFMWRYAEKAATI